MRHKPGQLLEANVDGKPSIIYLSLITDGTNACKRGRCYRYGPPSHEVVTGNITITNEDHYRTQRPTRPDGAGVSKDPS